PEVGSRAMSQAIEYLDNLKREVSESSSVFAVARNGTEMEVIIAAGKIFLLPMLEGTTPIGGHISGLEAMRCLGIRQIGLTWNYRNLVADGVAEEATRGGLTRFGRQVVEGAIEKRIAI